MRSHGRQEINPETGKRDDYNPDLVTEQRIEARPDDKSGCLTTVQKDNVLIMKNDYFERFIAENASMTVNGEAFEKWYSRMKDTVAPTKSFTNYGLVSKKV